MKGLNNNLGIISRGRTQQYNMEDKLKHTGKENSRHSHGVTSQPKTARRKVQIKTTSKEAKRSLQSETTCCINCHSHWRDLVNAAKQPEAASQQS